MKKIYVEREEMMKKVNMALASAVFEMDTQIIFDGEDFQVQPLFDASFAIGYVIKHAPYSTANIPDGGEEVDADGCNDFQRWLANELFIHANAMHEYFRKKEKIFICDK